MQEKIFVTGGTGFLGSYLLRYLVQQGYQDIRAIKRASSSMALVEEIADKIQWVEGDILDVPFLEEAMLDRQQVYHCAALVSFDPKEAARMKQINVTGTANMVNISLLHNIQKLVHISSIASLGKEKEGKWIDEQTKWTTDKQTSNYAKSKRYAELEVWRGIAEGLNAAILNPSLILGSGFWDSGPCNIFRMYASGFSFYSAGVVGMVDVRDVARAAIQLMESNIQEQRLIISAENLPYQDLFNRIAIAANQQPPSRKISTWMKSVAWRAEWLRSSITGNQPTLTKESVQSADSRNFFQNQRSIELLKMKYTPLQTTIAETVQQFLEAQNQGNKPMVLPLN